MFGRDPGAFPGLVPGEVEEGKLRVLPHGGDPAPVPSLATGCWFERLPPCPKMLGVGWFGVVSVVFQPLHSASSGLPRLGWSPWAGQGCK